MGLQISIEPLAAAITAIVAVLGLVGTMIYSDRVRRDNVRTNERDALHSYANQLGSADRAERAVGISTTIDYLGRRRLQLPASRLIVTALHYEVDPLIFTEGSRPYVGIGQLWLMMCWRRIVHALWWDRIEPERSIMP